MGVMGIPGDGSFQVIYYFFTKLITSCDQMWVNLGQLAIVFGSVSTFLALGVSVVHASSKRLSSEIRDYRRVNKEYKKYVNK